MEDSRRQEIFQEWRDFGFYFAIDTERYAWFFVGSRTGLLKLGDIIEKYVSDPRNQPIGEHEHYGFYFALTFRTWTQPRVDADGIEGSFDDLRRLGNIIRTKLAVATVGSEFIIKDEFSPDIQYSMHFDVKPEGFDPASADTNNWPG